jgi:paraquat-inducible protein A
MNAKPLPLIACHECDLLQREVVLPPRGTARCRRCGALLYRNSPDCLNRSLALTLAAAVLYLVANLFPIIGIELQGNRNAMNLYSAVRSLWSQEMHSISLTVFITTILIPAMELAMLTYLLVPLKFRRVPAGVAMIMRVLQSIKPWGMVEVFMLGILVSLVKLNKDFIVIPGVALWSFGGLTLLLAAVAASFNPRDIWAHLELQPGIEEGT